jgi:hypothetical protein
MPDLTPVAVVTSGTPDVKKGDEVMTSTFWDGFRLGMFQAAGFGGAILAVVLCFVPAVQGDGWLAYLVGVTSIVGFAGWGLIYNFAWRPRPRNAQSTWQRDA